MAGRSWMRPRVYLIDFETAVEFSPETLPANRLSSELPVPAHEYRRKRPDELIHEPLLYCPFRLDIWQFGYDLVNGFSVRCWSHFSDVCWLYLLEIKTTGIPELDTLWPRLMARNPQDRPSPQTVLDELGAFVRRTPPDLLHIPFANFWTFIIGVQYYPWICYIPLRANPLVIHLESDVALLLSPALFIYVLNQTMLTGFMG